MAEVNNCVELFSCEMCGVSSLNAANYKSHLLGKKHQHRLSMKRLEKELVRDAECARQDSENKFRCHLCCTNYYNLSFYTDHIMAQHQRPVKGSPAANCKQGTEALGLKQQEGFIEKCRSCDDCFDSNISYQNHLSSIHQKSSKAHVLPEVKVQESSQENTHAGSHTSHEISFHENSKSKENTVESDPCCEMEDATSGSYMCVICSKSFSEFDTYRLHVERERSNANRRRKNLKNLLKLH